MSDLGPERTEYEIITTRERIRRDPRGLGRVTILSGGYVLLKKAAQPHIADSNQEQDIKTTEEGEQ